MHAKCICLKLNFNYFSGSLCLAPRIGQRLRPSPRLYTLGDATLRTSSTVQLPVKCTPPSAISSDTIAPSLQCNFKAVVTGTTRLQESYDLLSKVRHEYRTTALRVCYELCIVRRADNNELLQKSQKSRNAPVANSYTN